VGGISSWIYIVHAFLAKHVFGFCQKGMNDDLKYPFLILICFFWSPRGRHQRHDCLYERADQKKYIQLEIPPTPLDGYGGSQSLDFLNKMCYYLTIGSKRTVFWGSLFVGVA
jgi:hypothetical protein